MTFLQGYMVPNGNLRDTIRPMRVGGTRLEFRKKRKFLPFCTPSTLESDQPSLYSTSLLFHLILTRAASVAFSLYCSNSNHRPVLWLFPTRVFQVQLGRSYEFSLGGHETFVRLTLHLISLKNPVCEVFCIIWNDTLYDACLFEFKLENRIWS